jgi:hypothetical protein
VTRRHADLPFTWNVVYDLSSSTYSTRRAHARLLGAESIVGSGRIPVRPEKEITIRVDDELRKAIEELALTSV